MPVCRSIAWFLVYWMFNDYSDHVSLKSKMSSTGHEKQLSGRALTWYSTSIAYSSESRVSATRCSHVQYVIYWGGGDDLEAIDDLIHFKSYVIKIVSQIQVVIHRLTILKSCFRNNNGELKINKLLITQFSTASCYFFLHYKQYII
jgi:hypothetical protein